MLWEQDVENRGAATVEAPDSLLPKRRTMSEGQEIFVPLFLRSRRSQTKQLEPLESFCLRGSLNICRFRSKTDLSYLHSYPGMNLIDWFLPIDWSTYRFLQTS